MPERITVIRDDITRLKVDAIVNAANSSLMGGGGVDGAIHRAGGPSILNECRDIISRLGSCKTGEAVITTAGDMPSRFVIHTVGPVWHGGNYDEARLLENCYRKSMHLAVENDVKSIAFPNISTGIYGFPKQQAANIAVNTVQSFLSTNQSLEKVVFVCFDDENLHLYKALLS